MIVVIDQASRRMSVSSTVVGLGVEAVRSCSVVSVFFSASSAFGLALNVPSSLFFSSRLLKNSLGRNPVSFPPLLSEAA
jgi:hypothetical protein